MTSLKRTLRYLLPHDTARAVHRLVNPAGARELARLRETELRPFFKHRAIFVHIPKCAGTSMTSALFGESVGNHMTIGDLKLAFSAQEFAQFFKFAVVRNPWDRLLSTYYYFRDGGTSERDRIQAKRLIGPHADFRSFVMGFVTEENVEDADHFTPQYRYVCTSRRGPVLLDFVARFETLERDFALISERLGIGATLDKQNKGKSRPQEFRAAYDAAMVAAVGRAYRRDIELFGYSFDART